MIFPLDLFNDPTGTIYWSFHDNPYIYEGAIIASIVLLYIKLRLRGVSKDVEPLTMLSEFDKSGRVKPYKISDEQEGAVLLLFERSSGEVENRRIGQPFTFWLDKANIERNHFNPRGAHECLDPAKMKEGYKPDPKEKNVIVAETTQHFRQLRLGGSIVQSARSHIRMFILIFALACMIGVGMAAVLAPHH